MNTRMTTDDGCAGGAGTRRQTRIARQCFSGCALAAVLVGLVGCDKVPTFDELIHGKKKEAPKVAAPPPESVEKPAPVVQAPPAPPAKKPQEVIAAFNATPHQQRNDVMLIELANLREGKEQITDMDLSYSGGITETGIAQLPKLDHIEKLNLDFCQYNNYALREVAKMNSVTVLSIKGGAPKDRNSDLGLGFIKGMKQLTSLTVDHATFSPAGLQSIAAMTWLESLSMNDCDLNDEGVSALGGLVHLKNLSLANTLVGDEGLPSLAPLHELEVLNLGLSRRGILGAGLKQVLSTSNFPNLWAIFLFSNRSLNQKAYEGLLKLKNQLKVLDLSETNLNDQFFIGGVSKLSKLEELYLARNPNISDEAMLKLPNLRHLRKLNFEKSRSIGDRTVAQVSKLGKTLESVSFQETAVNERAAERLKKKWPKVDVIWNGKHIEE